MDWETWGPPLVVLGVSSVIAFGIVAMMKSEETDGGTQHADARRAELEAKKDQLMEALRELDADKTKLSEDSYTAQREELLSWYTGILWTLGQVDRRLFSPSSRRWRDDWRRDAESVRSRFDEKI